MKNSYFAQLKFNLICLKKREYVSFELHCECHSLLTEKITSLEETALLLPQL